MPHRFLALALVIATLPALAWSQQAEPEYYLKPEKTEDYWKAIKFEVSLGKYEVAAGYIKALLEKNPTEEELLAIEAKDGIAPLLNLRNIGLWNKIAFPEIKDKFERQRKEEKATARNDEAKKNAETLIEKVTAALKAKLSDVNRITKFANALKESREEAAYAEKELYRSGSVAVPILVSLLRSDADLRQPIRGTLSRLDLSTVPAVLAALEIPDTTLRLELLEALRDRSDYLSLPAQVETDPIPILNYFSSNLPSINETLRAKAISMLGGLTVKDTKNSMQPELNSPQGQLWSAANKIYEHKARFRDTTQVTMWVVEAGKLVAKIGSLSDGEEFFGLKYLRWALQIQPDYLPAQNLFLKLAIEKHFQRTGLDKPLSETSPELHELLVGAPYELLTDLMKSSIQEQKTSIALAVIEALGDRGDPRSIASSTAGDKSRKPSLLEQALNHPDFRVQFAAAVAILRIPSKTAVAPDAVVKILVQAVRSAVESVQKGKNTALIGDFDELRSNALANLLRKAGFEVELLKTGRDLVRRLADNANIELVILDSSIPYPPASDVLAQMRSDSRMKSIPVLLSKGFENKTANKESLIRLAGYYRNVVLVDEMLTEGALKEGLTKVLVTADTQPLSADEKKKEGRIAIDWLKRIALGEKPGYSIAGAASAFREAFNDSALILPAIEGSAAVANKELQQDLANLFLNADLPIETRLKAGEAVVRQLQLFGSALAPNQLATMNSLMKTEANPQIKGKLTAILGVLQANSKMTGEALRNYVPKSFTDTPPAPKEKQ